MEQNITTENSYNKTNKSIAKILTFSIIFFIIGEIFLINFDFGINEINFYNYSLLFLLITFSIFLIKKQKDNRKINTSIAIILIFIIFYSTFGVTWLYEIGLNSAEINFFLYFISLILIMFCFIIFKSKVNWSLKWNDIYFVVLSFLLIKLFDNISYSAYSWFGPKAQQSTNQALLVEIKNQYPFYFYAITIVLGPICEEFFYRYGFQNFFKKYFSIHSAIILTALIFGYYHIKYGLLHYKNYYELIHLVQYSGASIVFSYVYKYSKRLSVPILCHMVYNFIVIIIA